MALEGRGQIAHRRGVTVPPLASLTSSDGVTALWGVGEERAAQLARLGIHTVGDFLLHRPRRHEDRRQVRAIGEIQDKGPVTVRGRVLTRGVKYFRGRSRSVFQLILEDGTGRVHCRWWNMPFLEGQFAVGMEVMAHGPVVDLRPRTIEHPETEVLEGGEEARIHLDRIVPIYPLTEGLTQRWMRARLWTLVNAVAPGVPEPHPGMAIGGLPSRAAALRALHFPEALDEAEAARQRLAFDEFVELQLAIQGRRQRLYSRAKGCPCAGHNRLMRPFLAALGFTLTDGQAAVLREIRTDMGSGRPMRRLLQGDVGSGKTVVAACAALMAVESGFQAALMAPTEILAQQHARRFRAWFEPLGVPVEVRTGSGRAGDLDVDRAGLVLGTHALLSTGFEGGNLGLVIIDEQHKFGVAQREALVRKGRYPHLLVMTATPIPRTLALTLYGDLDCSVIREGPPGRGGVRTFVRGREALPRVWEFVREQLAAGRQAYIVYPRVEDDGSGDVRAVTREWEALRHRLAPYSVGLLHGRLGSGEKDRVMTAFQEGSIQALVATVVIEVGVDVPNATVMVIENAEHFGLAQLHQLRGRIGRGGHDAYCILVAARRGGEIDGRLRAMEACRDGFAIAEADLRLRGPGELLGQAQSGLPPLRFGDLTEDGALLERARVAVAEFLGRSTEAADQTRSA